MVDLGKLFVAKGFKSCPKSNKSPNLVTLHMSKKKNVCDRLKRDKTSEIWRSNGQTMFDCLLLDFSCRKRGVWQLKIKICRCLDSTRDRSTDVATTTALLAIDTPSKDFNAKTPNQILCAMVVSWGGKLKCLLFQSRRKESKNILPQSQEFVHGRVELMKMCFALLLLMMMMMEVYATKG